MRNVPREIRDNELVLKVEVEFNWRDDANLEELQKHLEKSINQNAAEQLVFVLKTMREKSFVNQCDRAVKYFGVSLIEHWGGEESFFDLLSSDSEFMELRSEVRLNSNFKNDKYHSIAMISLPNNKVDYLIFDLVYGHIAGEGKRKNALFLSYKGESKRAVLDELKKIYGGTWKIINTLDKDKKVFRFNV
jgi:hypothetical protein